LAVVSDIHGNLPALEAVLAHARRAGFDAVVNLGDIASGPLWPRETVDLLMAEGWITLAGNHERQVLTDPPDRMGESDAFAAAALGAAHKAWLAALPATAAWLDDEVLLCHGAPDSDLTDWLETVTPDFAPGGSRGVRPASAAEAAARLPAQAAGRPSTRARLALCGHTHLPRTLQLPGGPLVVNPGSVGLPAYHARLPHPHDVENGTPHARYAIVERRAGGGVHVEQIAVPYDHAHAAERAARNSRPDWEHALATGFVAPVG
jgi:predicted phosphodiesterase